MRGRPISLRTSPLADDPQWYKDAVIYELRTRSFVDSNGDGIGDFTGLASKLDYLHDLGITALWLLPFYPSPGRDDGYDTADYTDVHPDVGTLADFDHFLGEAHRRGIRVITELVLNHTSDVHPWFQRARRAPPGSPERDFYVWSDTPDRYRGARIIFQDFEPSNWSWDRVAGAYYWHRFYAHQPDLNFENPAVQEALLRVVDFWFERGVDGLRLDAVPYLYEEEGTNCENLPKTHAFLRKLRAHVDARFKNRMLLAEANQWPEDAAAYFGAADECHMNFHFPLMPRMFMAIHMEDRLPIVDILAQTPQIAPSSQWALFLRNHDELTLEMVTDDERDYMYKAYAHEAPMRINLGIRRRLAPLVGNDRRKMELLSALLFSLPGTPVLYYGDEIGMGDNIFLGDRNGVRTPMQWSSDKNAGFSRANPQRLILPINVDPEYHYESVNVEAQQGNPNSLLWWTKRIIALRKQFRAFGRGTIDFLNPSNPRVLAFFRELDGELILVVANLSRHVQFVELDLKKHAGLVPIELFGRTRFPAIPSGDQPYLLTLGAHAFYWFSIEKAQPSEAAERVSLYDLPTIECTSEEALLRGGERRLLEEALPTFIESRPWFDKHGQHVTAARVVDALPMGEGATASTLVLVRAEVGDDDPGLYVVPLAVTRETGDGARPVAGSTVALLRTGGSEAADATLFEAVDDPARARTLLEAIVKHVRSRGEAGALAAAMVDVARTPGAEGDAAIAPLPTAEELGGALEAKKLGGGGGGRTTTLRFGDRAVVTLYRRVDEGVSPELEVLRHLSRTARAPAPRLLGTISYERPRAEPLTLGVVTELVANEGTALHFTQQELRRYFERVLARAPSEPMPPVPKDGPMRLSVEPLPQAVRDVLGVYVDSAALLGKRSAELHLALAQADGDPAFAPEPYSALDRRSKYQSLRNLAGAVLRELGRAAPGLQTPQRTDARAILEREADILRRFEPLLSPRMASLRIRSHGNMNLAHVLYTGRDFVFVGFQGTETTLVARRRKRSPLRDLAGMVRSFDVTAARVVLDPSAVREHDRARATDWARIWTAHVGARYLAAYRERAAANGAQFVPEGTDDAVALFDAFLFERALHQVRIGLERGGDDLAAPLSGLVELLRSSAPTPA